MSNKHIIYSLVSSLIAKLPERYFENLVIFGSAAICLNQIKLNREVNDLDLYLSVSTYRDMKKESNVKEVTKGYIKSLVWRGLPDVEFFKEFPGVSFEEVKLTASYNYPIKFARVPQLIKWKEGQIKENPREKDYKDIMRLINYDCT